MARTPRAQAPVVSWRDGVHLTGTSIWCDSRRRRDVCFVSSSDRIGHVGHGQLIGTPITLALVAPRKPVALAGHLAVPVRRPFTLGTLRLELIPSGRGLGAAALHVDARGRTVFYAGPVRTTDSREAAEVRVSDVVVVAAPFGDKHHEFAPLDDIAGELVAWIRAQLAARKLPVIVVDSSLDGLEVATRLAAEGVAIAGSATIRDAAKRLAKLEPVPPIRAPGKAPAAVIRIVGDRLAVDGKPVTALVSARAIDPQPEFAASFAWPFAAGRAQLLAWIEQTKARAVFVTGPCAETIVQTLGTKARVLGPPHQLTLFGAAR